MPKHDTKALQHSVVRTFMLTLPLTAFAPIKAQKIKIFHVKNYNLSVF
jgi:hypothetical protein